MNQRAFIECRLTGVIGKGVRSHLVPRSFYELPPQEMGALEMLSNIDGKWPKKLRQGVYDTTILTAEGEDYFNGYDDYAYDLLYQSDQLERTSDCERLCYWSGQVDYLRLKIFLLSVLWRVGVSEHDTARNIKLGVHEDRIREIILTGQLPNDWQYPIVISRWFSDKNFPYMMLY